MSPIQTLMTQDQKPMIAGFLRTLNLFSVFSDQQIVKLVETGKLTHFNKASTIVVEGENSQGLHVIAEGLVSVHKSASDGTSLVRLAHLEKGAIFGELSLINKAPRAATVIAESPVQTFELEADNFQSFINQTDMAVKLGFYKNCSEDLAERFRLQNEDYLNTQRLLWKKAFTKTKSA